MVLVDMCTLSKCIPLYCLKGYVSTKPIKRYRFPKTSLTVHTVHLEGLFIYREDSSIQLLKLMHSYCFISNSPTSLLYYVLLIKQNECNKSELSFFKFPTFFINKISQGRNQFVEKILSRRYLPLYRFFILDPKTLLSKKALLARPKWLNILANLPSLNFRVC